MTRTDQPIQPHACTVWYTLDVPGRVIGVAYCERYGWHAVDLTGARKPLRKKVVSGRGNETGSDE